MESCVVEGSEEEEINEGEDEGDEGEEDDGDKGDPDRRTLDGACSLPSAGDHSNIILRVTRSNHMEQGKFKNNVIKKNF